MQEVSVLEGKFNRDRLRKALDIKCMTLSDLAKEVGVSRQTISDYINNDNASVDLVKIKRISEILNFPFNFFYETDSDVKTNAAYFRSQLTTKKFYRSAQKCKLELIARIYNFIKEYVEFPVLNIPDCRGLSPEEAALKLREEWNLGLNPIENIIPIAEQNGLIVVCYDTETDAIDAFSQRFILDNNAEVFIIGYSSNKKSAARIHFDIAHELGHICLHDWYCTDELEKDEFKEKEDEANRFASALLLPEEPFLYDVCKAKIGVRDYSRLKRKWKTSIAAMLMRANRLGVITNEDYKNMIIKMQKLGIRKQEPLDNDLITAEPSILKTSVSLLLSNDVFTKEEFMDSLTDEGNLTLYPQQVEQLLGLQRGTLQSTKRIEFPQLTLKNV